MLLFYPARYLMPRSLSLTVRLGPDEQRDSLEPLHVGGGDVPRALVVPLALGVERVQLHAAAGVGHLGRNKRRRAPPKGNGNQHMAKGAEMEDKIARFRHQSIQNGGRIRTRRGTRTRGATSSYSSWTLSLSRGLLHSHLPTILSAPTSTSTSPRWPLDLLPRSLAAAATAAAVTSLFPAAPSFAFPLYL